MNPSTHLRTAGAIATALLLASATSPAGASSQSAPQSASITALGAGNCALARVDTHFARCDYLTGAGVPAPVWVPEVAGGATTQAWPAHGQTI